jgi:P4 family phage/plasmid primase-like protien
LHQILSFNGSDSISWQQGYRAPSVAAIYANPEEYISDIPADKRVNIFFTMMTCTEEAGRKFVSQDTIQFDVDKIEDTEETNLWNIARIVCQTLKVDHKKTGILFTGHGLQFMVQINTVIDDAEFFGNTKHHYNAWCDAIDLALSKAKIHGLADRKVWDKARVMRYPNTINQKPEKNPVKGRILQSQIEAQEFDIMSILPRLGIADTVLDSVLNAFPVPDTQSIFQDCKVLQYCQASPEKVTQGEWYAMVCVTARMDKGRELTHQLSKGYPGYSEQETDMIIDRALSSTTGPRTCKNLNVEFGGKCVGCKHHGSRLSTPLLIEGPDYIRTEKNGFHNVEWVEQANGSSLLRTGKPNIEDLWKRFTKDFEYISLDESGVIRIYNGKFYENMSDMKILAYADAKFNPKVIDNTRQEFIKRVRLRNLKPSNFFSTYSAGFVNFNNGVYDIEKDILLTHANDYGFMSVLNCDYDPNAKAPRFEKFIEQVTKNDKELANILQEFMGYTLSGMECSFQKMLMLLGDGENGKSVFVNVIRALIGRNGYSSLSIKDMNNPQSRVLLEGRLVNIAEENSADSFRDTELVKNFARGGEVSVKYLYKQPYEFTNKAKLIMLCNNLPRTRDTSHGFFRSFLMVPFNEVFSYDKGNKDPEILAKLIKELPGIFNWAMEGYHRLLVQGRFTEAKASQALLDEYKDTDESVFAWASDYLIYEQTGKFFPTIELYEHYSQYCKITNSYMRDIKGFTKQLEVYLRNCNYETKKERAYINGKQQRGFTNVSVGSEF